MRRIKHAFLAAALVLAATIATFAQGPQLTHVTGHVYDASGQPVPSARLKIVKVLKGGVAVSTKAVAVVADAEGAVDFYVLRGSTTYIEGAVVQYEREGGVPVPIPDAETATFESLTPTVTVPTSALLTHAAVKGSDSQLGHFKVGSGLAVDGSGVLSVTAAGVTDHGALTGLSDDDHPQYQLRSEKNSANGYAGLDGSGLLPDNRLPASIARDSEVSAAVAAHEAGNGVHAIAGVTGLQAALDAKAAAADLTTEASARASADTTLQTNITAEASARAAAITAASTTDRARSNHTGTQTLSTISDAGTAAALNVPASGDAASGEIVKGSDTRLTNARTPSAHASTHASAGSDPLTLSESQVTGLVSDLAGKAAASHTHAESEVTNLVSDLAAKQASDATLTALAAHNTNGLLTQTAADTFTGRALTAGSAKIAVTNGNGVSGNPTVDLGTVGASDVGLSNVVNVTQERLLYNAWSGSNTGTGETDLVNYSLPAGTLSADGKKLRLRIFVSFAANANSKTVRIYFGSTVMTFPNAVAVNGGNGLYLLEVTRTGASAQSLTGRLSYANSNTGNEGGNSNRYEAPAENTANAITIKVTGQGSATGDVLLRDFSVEALN